MNKIWVVILYDVTLHCNILIDGKRTTNLRAGMSPLPGGR